MVGMVILLLVCIILFIGLFTESIGWLTFAQWSFVLVMIFEFTGLTCLSVYGVEESSSLTDQLKVVFLDLIYRMDYDLRASRILKKIQEQVRLGIFWKEEMV